MSLGQALSDSAETFKCPELTNAATTMLGKAAGAIVTAKTGSASLGEAASHCTQHAIENSQTATGLVEELAAGVANVVYCHVVLFGLIGYGVVKGIDNVLESIFE